MTTFILSVPISNKIKSTCIENDVMHFTNDPVHVLLCKVTKLLFCKQIAKKKKTTNFQGDSCVSWSFPLPSMLTSHLLIQSVFSLYALRPPRELIPYRVWQAVKNATLAHTIDVKLACRAVTRWVQNIFENDTISRAHKCVPEPLPTPLCVFVAILVSNTIVIPPHF